MTAQPHLLEEIHKIDSLLKTSQRRLADGHLVDLSALRDRVSKVCEAALDTAPDERATIRRALENLSHNLDVVDRDLRNFYGWVAESEAPGPAAPPDDRS